MHPHLRSNFYNYIHLEDRIFEEPVDEFIRVVVMELQESYRDLLKEIMYERIRRDKERLSTNGFSGQDTRP
jgi:hypothetical protein